MVESIRSFLSQARLLVLLQYKLHILFLFLGVLLVVGGLVLKNKPEGGNSNVEVLEDDRPGSEEVSLKLVVDVAGAVNNPGVYSLEFNSRVEDAIVAAGNLSADADINWVDKNLNKASKLVDGQKLYIPQIKQTNVLSATNIAGDENVAQSYSSSDSNLVNINTATLSELEGLPGIGQVYGKNIIDNRPYSDPSELLSKKVLKESTFEKIKDKVTTY